MVEYPFLDQKGGQPWRTNGTWKIQEILLPAVKQLYL